MQANSMEFFETRVGCEGNSGEIRTVNNRAVKSKIIDKKDVIKMKRRPKMI
jgi:hypothetical protein